MSIMHIQEYEDLANDGMGHVIQAGKEPKIASQAITFTATAGLSAAFNSRTRFVRISLDAAGFIKFGLTPTAVTAVDAPMAADTPEYFGVTSNSLKVSAVA